MTGWLLQTLDAMMLSISQLSTGDLVLRGALIGCTLFTTIQLLSMLATHYGDQNAVSKSFVLSLLLHCCLALGWATVVSQMPPRVATTRTPEPTPTRVSLTRGDDAEHQSGDATRAMWRTEHPTDFARTRAERAPTDLDLDAAERAASPSSDLPPEAASLPALSENVIAVPSAESAGAEARPVPAPTTLEVDSPSPAAREEFASLPNPARTPLNREGAALEPAPRQVMQRGSAERTSSQIESGVTLTLPNELQPEADSPKPIGIPETQIRRRSNPDPILADSPESGSSPTSDSALTAGPRREKFARSGSRTGVDPEFEPVAEIPSAPVLARVSPPLPPRFSAEGGGTSATPVPDLARPESRTIRPQLDPRDPEPYRSRRIEQRRAMALKNGGSEESERAVEASLKWMASIQESAGHWSAARHGGGAVRVDPQGNNRRDGGLYADSGLTGLVVLSFLGAGYTHEEGQYASTVRRAIEWLIAQQAPNGYLGGRATHYDMMYCHAMATFALAEAYGMQSDPDALPELRESLRRAVQLICDMQNSDGGWRYGRGTESDMSMFGWQLMALKSAVHAGIAVPEETRRGMTRFLQARALGIRGGLAGYKQHEPPSPAMTAEALFCRQMFSVQYRDAASQEAVAYLRQNLPHLTQYDEYYWYYGTLAMFQYDGKPWEDWNGALRDTLVQLQRTQGPLAGSWDPKGKWAGIGGRLYSTAISTMCLEVYYRFLRIYQSPD